MFIIYVVKINGFIHFSNNENNSLYTTYPVIITLSYKNRVYIKKKIIAILRNAFVNINKNIRVVHFLNRIDLFCILFALLLFPCSTS